MKTYLIAITTLASLVLLGSAFAKQYDPERSAPQNGCCMGECRSGCDMHPFKGMKHREMAREFRHESRHERRMARREMREFRLEQFGMPFLMPPRAREMRRERMRMQQEMFGCPMMGPQGPMGPPPGEFRRQMQFQDRPFGPMMNPDHPMGPPTYMRFRDGFRHPRAL